jgi:hypothetical protein
MLMHAADTQPALLGPVRARAVIFSPRTKYGTFTA